MSTGSSIYFYSDNDEPLLCYECYLKPGNGGSVRGDTYQGQRFINTTIDATADTGASANAILRADSGGLGGFTEWQGGSFINLSNRTSHLISDPVSWVISGVDLSTNTATTELFSGSIGRVVATNLKLPASQSLVPAASDNVVMADILMTNSGDADRPWWLFHWQAAGYVEAQTTYTRDNGASIGGTRVAWQYTAGDAVSGYSYMSPWIYGSISSTGSKTLTIHVANATDDLTDQEAAIQCEVLGTAGSPLWTVATDMPAITASGTAQADDTTSDWDNDLTYMQKLSVTTTINQAGQYRCRVIATTTQGFYIDPKVVVE